MHVILLGPPGAGKGTQARMLASHLHVPQIATGDILRQAVKSHTALGQSVEKVMNAGKLVPDELMIPVVKSRIQQTDCAHGFVLDGFPRTKDQALALDALGCPLDVIVELQVPDAHIVERLSGRRVHPASGRTYHAQWNPPQIPEIDDITQEPLIQRADDTPETVRKRLQVYHDQTAPLIAYYQGVAQAGGLHYLQISGLDAVEAVHAQLVQALYAIKTTR